VLFILLGGAAFVHDDARHQDAAPPTDDQQTGTVSTPARQEGRYVERHRVPPLRAPRALSPQLRRRVNPNEDHRSSDNR